ncbi:MAG TPA: NAD(P)/FAD-dependent oxidoreductase, partial [Urbifossiella sp.]
MIIGAGPAGSIAARELARRGASVLLVDKAQFPRPKVCGCCLNGAALAALDNLGLAHVPDKCGAVSLRSMILAAGRHSAELRLKESVSVSREAFDAALVRQAEIAGATFASGTMVKLDDTSSDECRSLTLAPGQKLLTRIAIVATGLSGMDSHADVGSRLGAGVIVPKESVPTFFETCRLYMATGNGGYVGLVRLEDDRLDIAAAFDAGFVLASGGLGRAAALILKSTAWPAIADLSEMPWKGTPALTRRPSAVAGHRLFAVGDAAGYVEPFTGEGMAWAISSASALAPIAVEALNSWDDRWMRQWQRTHARIVGRRQGVCRIAARVLRSPALTW